MHMPLNETLNSQLLWYVRFSACGITKKPRKLHVYNGKHFSWRARKIIKIREESSHWTNYISLIHISDVHISWSGQSLVSLCVSLSMSEFKVMNNTRFSFNNDPLKFQYHVRRFPTFYHFKLHQSNRRVPTFLLRNYSGNRLRLNSI